MTNTKCYSIFLEDPVYEGINYDTYFYSYHIFFDVDLETGEELIVICDESLYETYYDRKDKCDYLDDYTHEIGVPFDKLHYYKDECFYPAIELYFELNNLGEIPQCEN